MVFNIGPEIILTILIFISFAWLAWLTFYLQKSVSHYKSLTKETNSKNLQQALETLLTNQDLSKEEFKKINLNIDNIKKEALLHIQKVGFVRYNPFENTGGNQSFAISLLNALNDGIIISSLHSRSGPRWYVKWIKDSKGLELDLSKEEAEAIKIAQKVKE